MTHAFNIWLAIAAECLFQTLKPQGYTRQFIADKALPLMLKDGVQF